MSQQAEPELDYGIKANTSVPTKIAKPKLEPNEITEANSEKRVPRYTERIQQDGYDFVLDVYGSAQGLRRFAYEYIGQHGRTTGTKDKAPLVGTLPASTR